MLSERGSATEGDVNGSALREQWQEAHLDPATQRLLLRDEAVFLRQALSTPCLNAVRAASGSWIEDLSGKRYLDFHGNSVHQIGYGHPKVVRAVADHLMTLPFSPRRYTNETAIRLAERLVGLCPPRLGKVLLAPGGSAAMGMALKLARIVTGRHKTISMWDSFHGASLDAASVGGEERFRRDIGPLTPGSEHVPPPDPARCPLRCGTQCNYACANYLEYVLEREGDVAAVVAEPLRCTTVVPPPPDYWMRVRRACDQHGALLIFDEIPTAFGRTGKMFSHEWFGATPDILVLGKGLGGGVMPLAAMIVDSDFDIAEEYSIGHYTHEKSPICSAAGLAMLDVLEEEELVGRSLTLGARMVEDLKGSLSGHPSVVDVRGLGMLIGVELGDALLAEKCLYGCLAKGLSFKVSAGTVLTLAPPLNTPEGELELALSIVVDQVRHSSLS